MNEKTSKTEASSSAQMKAAHDFNKSQCTAQSVWNRHGQDIRQGDFSLPARDFDALIGFLETALQDG